MKTGTAVFIILAVFWAALALGAWLGIALERRRKAQEAAQEAVQARPAARPAKPEWLKSTQPQPGTAGFVIAAALNGIGCLGRSAADEPVFVLVARDKASSMVVRDWADMAEKLGAGRDKTWGAREQADRMQEWRERHGGGKVPD
jgi:cytochrome oxidase assembly protein ShyY1